MGLEMGKGQWRTVMWRGFGGGIRRSGRVLLRSGWRRRGQKNTVLTLYELTESEVTLSQGKNPLVVVQSSCLRLP